MRRDELLGLLHSTQEHQPITARMPAVTLETILVPEDLPAPPFVIRIHPSLEGRRRRATTLDDGDDAGLAGPGACSLPCDGVSSTTATTTNDSAPEVRIDRTTANPRAAAIGAAINAAIDAAVDEVARAPVDEAVVAALRTGEESPKDRRMSDPKRAVRLLLLVCGFALTFLAGIGIMMWIG